MSDQVTIPIGRLKQIGKWLLVALALAALVQGYRFERAFAADYQRLHNENLLMWSYLTYGYELADGKTQGRADLIHQMLVERFNPKPPKQ